MTYPSPLLKLVEPSPRSAYCITPHNQGKSSDSVLLIQDFVEKTTLSHQLDSQLDYSHITRQTSVTFLPQGLLLPLLLYT